MADQVPQSKINQDFLKAIKILVKKVEDQGAMIAELQGDRTTTIEGVAKLSEAVTDLQSHKEVVSGENGVVSQLGDLSENAEIHAELLAAVPEMAEAEPAAAPTAANEPANGEQHQAAA